MKKCYNQNMNHKIAMLGSLLIITASLAIGAKYQNMTEATQSLKSARQSVQAKVTAQKAVQTEQDKINAAVKIAIQKQCAADQATYNNLPATIKAKVPAPICFNQ